MIPTASEGLFLGFLILDLGFEFDAKKACTSGVGHNQAQKNRPSRIVTSTTRPTEIQASGTKLLLAKVVCKKPNGQVKDIPKSSKEQVFPHTKFVTVPAKMISMRIVAVMRRIARTLMLFFFLAIDSSTSTGWF
jgi:hypothetical protein